MVINETIKEFAKMYCKKDKLKTIAINVAFFVGFTGAYVGSLHYVTHNPEKMNKFCNILRTAYRGYEEFANKYDPFVRTPRKNAERATGGLDKKVLE